mgnify:CR=1 FL=1
MPSATPPVQATNPASSATGAQRSANPEVAGIPGLFARIAGQMQEEAGAELPAESEALATEVSEELAQSLGQKDSAAGADTLTGQPLTENTDLAEETETAQGIHHALHVLSQLREARTQMANSQGNADPLATALQAVGRAAEARPATGGNTQPLNTTAQTQQAQTQGNLPTLNPQLEALKSAQTGQGGNITLAARFEGLKPLESLQPSTVASGQHAALLHQPSAPRGEAVQNIPRFDVPGNIQQPAWQQALSERVVMLGRQDIKQAELHLHPAELGPVNIRIETARDQAAIQFAAVNADTREALEAALPRLREYFNQQGMNLVRADIQHHFGGQGQDPNQSGGSLFAPQTSVSTAEVQESLPQTTARAPSSDSLLDLYA